MKLINWLKRQEGVVVPEKKFTFKKVRGKTYPQVEHGMNSMHDQWANIEIPESRGVFCLTHKRVTINGICPVCSIECNGLNKTEFMKIMMPYHGGNPGTWHISMEKAWNKICALQPTVKVPSEEEVTDAVVLKILEDKLDGLKDLYYGQIRGIVGIARTYLISGGKS